MKRFAHITASSIEQVIPLLDARTRPLAGGTELLGELKEHLITPDRLVRLRDLPELRGIEPAGAGLRVGALTTLRELERDGRLRSGPYAALALAAGSAASPQLRNTATIGGNLLQDARCWYYRGPFNCWLKGGDECQARSGEHHLHALFEQSPCVAVQPSDPATALLALDAEVLVRGPVGERTLGLDALLAPPNAERRRLHALAETELILGLRLPDRTGWRSTYHKAMERAVYAFALAGVAVALRLDGGSVAEARIALGGVGNTPVLASSAAASLIGRALDQQTAAEAARLAVADAQPLPHTTYKRELAARLVEAALLELRD